MANLIVVTRDGSEKAIEAQPGLSVMEIIREHGFEVGGLCGGAIAVGISDLLADIDRDLEGGEGRFRQPCLDQQRLHAGAPAVMQQMQLVLDVGRILASEAGPLGIGAVAVYAVTGQELQP